MQHELCPLCKIICTKSKLEYESNGFDHLCRVQELAYDDRREAGRIPRTVECELTADLVDSCVPGDMVTITAIVKATGSEEGVWSSYT